MHVWRYVCVVVMLVLTSCGQTTTKPVTGDSTAAQLPVTCPDAPGPLPGPLVFGAAGRLVGSGLDGANPVRLTVLPQTAWAQNPSWSPDGQTLAYTLAQPTNDPNAPWLQVGMICGLDRVTGKGRMLAHGATIRDSLERVAWLPDGQSFAVTARTTKFDANNTFTGEGLGVMRYELASGQFQLLVKDAVDPTISPDGRLAYLRFDPVTYATTLMVSQLDGSSVQPITVTQQFSRIHTPQWSPDGRSLSLTASGGRTSRKLEPPRAQSLFDALFGVEVAQAHGEPSHIYVVDVAQQQLRQITSKGLDDPEATWSPDGAALVYVGGGSGSVQTFELATGQVRQITPQGDYGGIDLATR